MLRNELKPILKDFLKDMMNGWFDDNPILKVLGMSIIDANINKYDNVLDMFADENGDINTDALIDNLKNTMVEPIKIDLPILPNRILLISKEDLTRLQQRLIVL